MENVGGNRCVTKALNALANNTNSSIDDRQTHAITLISDACPPSEM